MSGRAVAKPCFTTVASLAELRLVEEAAKRRGRGGTKAEGTSGTGGTDGMGMAERGRGDG